MSTSSASGAPGVRSEVTIDHPFGRTIGRSSTTSARPDRSDDIDLAVAVDLVMLQRGLTTDEAHELLRGHAASTGRDLGAVVSDVIDLGTSRLPR